MLVNPDINHISMYKQRDSIMIRSALGGVRKYVAHGTRFYVAAECCIPMPGEYQQIVTL